MAINVFALRLGIASVEWYFEQEIIGKENDCTLLLFGPNEDDFNSSWHLSLKSDDSDFIQELRRLNNAFGIGIIKLNAEHISQSQVLYPSKILETLDWDTINRLSENPVFKDFLKEITSTKRSNTQKKVYDDVFSNDEECAEYCRKHNII